jgi:SDR family mycofactocin-dependent oxidoreductase
MEEHMNRMQGKTVLVTGAAREQGRAHALRLAKEGADLVLLDVAEQIGTVPYDMSTPDDLAQVEKEVEALDRRVLAVQADVRSQAAVDDVVARAVSEFGGLDAVVSNAGIWSLGAFWELSDQQWQDSIDVNLTGHWRVARAVAPHLIERGAGVIVFISSVNGLEAGAGYAHYTAAKHGLIGLMRTVAVEIGPHGVRAHAVCPGFIDTKMNDYQGSYDLMAGAAPGEGTPEARIAASRHWSILKGHSVIKPEAVSEAVLWLTSDESSETSGLVVPVDAGHMVMPAFNPAPIA